MSLPLRSAEAPEQSAKPPAPGLEKLVGSELRPLLAFPFNASEHWAKTL